MTKYNKHISCPSHCCILHGCKYLYDDCPVANGTVVQDHPCYDCSMEGIKGLKELKFKQAASVMEISSTDGDFMVALIDFLNSYPAKPDSVVIRSIK